MLSRKIGTHGRSYFILGPDVSWPPGPIASRPGPRRRLQCPPPSPMQPALSQPFSRAPAKLNLYPIFHTHLLPQSLPTISATRRIRRCPRRNLRVFHPAHFQRARARHLLKFLNRIRQFPKCLPRWLARPLKRRAIRLRHRRGDWNGADSLELSSGSYLARNKRARRLARRSRHRPTFGRSRTTAPSFTPSQNSISLYLPSCVATPSHRHRCHPQTLRLLPTSASRILVRVSRSLILATLRTRVNLLLVSTQASHFPVSPQSCLPKMVLEVQKLL